MTDRPAHLVDHNPVVYRLELEGRRWYVGKTTCLLYRLWQHWSGQGGAVWTELYRPVALNGVWSIGGAMTADKLEWIKTLESKRIWGITNVDGHTGVTAADVMARDVCMPGVGRAG